MGEQERTHFPLNVLDDIVGKGEITDTKITILDAGSRAAELLIPQYASDDDWNRKGKIDYRRFGHHDAIDPYWCTFFQLIPKEQGGGYASKFVEIYANWMYGVDGRHKKLGVEIQRAVSGKDKKKDDKKKRSLTDRILGRNKDVEE